MLTTYLFNLFGCALLYFFTSHALMVLYRGGFHFKKFYL